MHKNAKEPHESVGWISEERQKIRFQKLIEGLELESRKILDFGCGLGSFCGFLEERGIRCEYVGIDIVSDFVKKASAAYPNSRFLATSILDIDETFDFVFSSGVFAFSSKELFIESVKKSFELAKEAYRFNVLLNASGRGYMKISKEELQKTIGRICKDVFYNYGYLENDITVHMGKL